MNYDHIIIGAGVLGGATAYHLKRQQPEARILLLEKEARPGMGSTGKSAALYRNIFSSETSRQLAASSISYYNQLGSKIRLNPTGYLWLFSREQWDSSVAARAGLDPQRDQLEFKDSTGATELIDINTGAEGKFSGVHAGIHGHNCGALSAMALANHYVEEFRKLGGLVQFNTMVNLFKFTGRGSRFAPWDNVRVQVVRDQNGIGYEADNFIVTVGPWSHDLLRIPGVACGVLPKKRQLFGLWLRNPRDFAPKWTDGMKMPAIILPAGGIYIKPVLKRKMLIVGCADDLGQPYGMNDPEPDVHFFYQAIQPALDHYFPGLNLRLKQKWSGFYAYHWPDKNPVVETVKNLTWCSGTSGSGIMKADALGRITAGKLLGEESVELADGSKFRVSDLSLRERKVETEKFII